MRKITIIGSGSVGSTIAYTLMIEGLASEIVMIDINDKKAYGEALDIQQGTPFCTPCSVYSGEYSDAADSWENFQQEFWYIILCYGFSICFYDAHPVDSAHESRKELFWNMAALLIYI